MQLVDIQPLGDAAALATARGLADAEARQLAIQWAAACRQQPLPGVTDLVPAFGVLGVCFDPTAFSNEVSPFERVAEWLRERSASATDQDTTESRDHCLPVCYGESFGPDLEEVADQAGLSQADVIELHTAVRYTVGAVGFTPGFGYLEGLPQALHTPRRPTPRVAASAGSIGIGGRYTGAYPSQSPGGWNLIGRTPSQLFDPASEPPAMLSPGDHVRFRPISSEEFSALVHTLPTGRQPMKQVDLFRVASPGAQTTLQDMGRSGQRSTGVTAAGAMDAMSLRLANLLAGADENATALEASLTGPLLECLHDTVVGVAGALPAEFGRPRRMLVRRGDRIDLRPLTGARAYLAVAGGFASECVLGGSSTDLIAGWGGFEGRALRSGDILGTCLSSAEQYSLQLNLSGLSVSPSLGTRGASEVVLRCLPGPQQDSLGNGWREFLDAAYIVGRQSNRMGARLDGPRLAPRGGEGMPSQPVAPGVVQAPPDGRPIVLAADSQTLGGYPVVACVASVDLPRLGQLSPGDRVRFAEVTLQQAEQLRREAEISFRHTAAGIAAHDA